MFDNILAIYLVAINMIAFLAFGIDKWKARRKRFRTPEAVLMLLAAVGGSVGAIIAMLLFRHKTKHAKFAIGLPLVLVAQIAFWLLFR